jgi:hypothetical protein
VSNNPQGDRAFCEGDPAEANPVLITVVIGLTRHFSIPVGLDGFFTIVAQEQFGPETFATVFDSSGTQQLQKLRIHTSCAQPIAVGDKFGSLEIAGLVLAPK